MNSAPSSTGCPLAASVVVWTRPPSLGRASSSTTRRPASTRRPAAASPATPPPITTTSVPIRGSLLFVSKRHDGIEPGRAPRGPEPEEESDGGTESKGDSDRGGRDEGVPLHDLREHNRGPYPQQNP